MDRRALVKDFFLVVTGAVVGSGATAFWTRRIEEELEDRHSLFVRVDPLHIVGTRLVDHVLLLVENDGDVAETNVDILISFSARSADPMPVLQNVLSKPRILREQLAHFVAYSATPVAGVPWVEVQIIRSVSSPQPGGTLGPGVCMSLDRESCGLSGARRTRQQIPPLQPPDLTRISTPVITPVR